MVTFGEIDMELTENGYHNNNVSIATSLKAIQTIGGDSNMVLNEMGDIRVAFVEGFVLSNSQPAICILIICDSTTAETVFTLHNPSTSLQFQSADQTHHYPDFSLIFLPQFCPESGCLSMLGFSAQFCPNSDTSPLSAFFEDVEWIHQLRDRVEDHFSPLVSETVTKIEMPISASDNRSGNESPLNSYSISSSSPRWLQDQQNFCLACHQQYRTVEDFLDHAASVHNLCDETFSPNSTQTSSLSRMIFSGRLFFLRRLQSATPPSPHGVASLSHSSNKENEETEDSPTDQPLEIDFTPRSTSTDDGNIPAAVVASNLATNRMALSLSHHSSNSSPSGRYPSSISPPINTNGEATLNFSSVGGMGTSSAMSLPPSASPFAAAQAVLMTGGMPTPPLGLPAFNQSQMNFLLSLAAAQAHAQTQQNKVITFDELPQTNIGVGSLPAIPTMTSSSGQPGGHCARNSNKTIKCPHCNWHYKYQETLEIHLRDKHPEFGVNGSGVGGSGGLAAGSSQCFYCQNKQPHPRLSRGETYSCGYKPYRCEVCNYSTTTKGNLSIHIQSDKHVNNMHEHNQNLEMNRMTSSSAAALDLTAGLPTHHTMSSNTQQAAVSQIESSTTGQTPCSVTISGKELQVDLGKPSVPALPSRSSQMQDMMISAFNASLNHRLLPIPATNSAGVTILPSILPSTQHHIHQQATGGARVAPDQHHTFFCNICMIYGSNNLEDIQNHATLQRRSDDRGGNDDTMIYHEGYWHCRLCTYKSNLKANFQLHCKTDKHLQRQQLLSHVREGGAQNELRFPTLSSASSVQIRCNACNFFSTSVHKLRVHVSQAKHEHCATLLHHLNKLEMSIKSQKSPLQGGNGLVGGQLYECRLCQISFPIKMELVQHLQTEQHEATYSAIQFQYQSQNRLLELNEIVRLRQANIPDMTHLQESYSEVKSLKQENNVESDSQIPKKQCPLCKKSYFTEDQEMRFHLEQEHKITSECVDKFIEMAVLINRPVTPQEYKPSLDSSEIEFVITNDPSDISADALLLPEEFKMTASNGDIITATNNKLPEDDTQVLRCPGCTATFTDIDDLCQHASEQGHTESISTGANGGFLCFKKGCNQYFQSMDFLKLHYREIHRKLHTTTTTGTPVSPQAEQDHYTHPCQMCGLLSFPSEDALEAHKERHSVVANPLQCPYCPIGDSDEESETTIASCAELRHHYDLCHTRATIFPSAYSQISGSGMSSFTDPTRKFKCFACKLGFERQVQLAAHTRSNIHKRMTLDTMETSFPLGNHSRYMDPTRKFKCDICRDAFTSHQMLTNHNNSVQHTVRVREFETSQNSKSLAGQFKCNVCKVAFHQKYEFEQHCMTGEHLTYLANISRLVQEGKMETDKLLLEAPESPQQNSSDILDYTRSSATSMGTTTVSAVATSTATPNYFPLSSLSSSMQMLPPVFPLLPAGINPSMLSQFLPQLFFRFPFAAPPGSLPSFPPTSTIAPPISSASTLSTTCPFCSQFIANSEALLQHPCFKRMTLPGGIPGLSMFPSGLSEYPGTSAILNGGADASAIVEGNKIGENTDSSHKGRRPESFRKLLEKTGLDNVKLFLETSGGEDDLIIKSESLNESNNQESILNVEETESSPTKTTQDDETSEFFCQKCDRRFNESLLLRLHYEQVHNDILPTSMVQDFGEKLRDYMIEANKSQQDTDNDRINEDIKNENEEDTEEEKSMDEDFQKPLVICTETSTASNNDSADMSVARGIDVHNTIAPTPSCSTMRSSSMRPTSSQLPASGAINLLQSSVPRGSFVQGPYGMLPAPLGFSLTLLNQSGPQSAGNKSTPISSSQFTPPPPPISSQSVSAPISFSTASVLSTAADSQKRGRTRINEEQLKVLRSYFDISNSPSDAKIQEMCQMTGLQNRVIKHWFRNTLFKERQRNKNSPYNFSVPPSTSLNLEEYEKTGRVEVKSSPEYNARRSSPEDVMNISGTSMEENHIKCVRNDFENQVTNLGSNFQPLTSIDQNKNFKTTNNTAASIENPRITDVSQMEMEIVSAPISPSSSVSLSESGTSEGEIGAHYRSTPSHLQATSSSSALLHTTTAAAALASAASSQPITNIISSSHPPTNILMTAGAPAGYNPWAELILSGGSQSGTANLLAAAVAANSSAILPPSNSVGTVSDYSSHDSSKSSPFLPAGGGGGANKIPTMKRKLREDEEDDAPPGKRIRTTISSDQQEVLLNYYQKDPNPSRKQMDIIANQVVLSKRVVQVWFQNTRSRDRKGLLRASNSVIGGANTSLSSSSPSQVPLVAASSTFVTINKRCPFCRVLFKVRNALEVHLIQCHSDRCAPGQISVDNLPSEPETTYDTIPLQQAVFPTQEQSLPPLPQSQAEVKQHPMDDDAPLDLSRASGSSVRSTNLGDDLDDSQTVYWDDDYTESGGLGGATGSGSAGSGGGGCGGGMGNKRNRTNINLGQMRLMKSIFHYYKTPSNQECDSLGSHIGLTRRVVQVWFQNQRAKEKKQCRDTFPLGGKSCGGVGGSKGPLLTCVEGEDHMLTGCELCGTTFSNQGSFLIQEHLFSSGHLDRLLRQINVDDNLHENLRHSQTSSLATSPPPSVSALPSLQSDGISSSCGVTVSSAIIGQPSFMFPPNNFPRVWSMPQISVNGKLEGK